MGVALFATALIWLIALVTYEPSDPVWFFTTGVSHPPANFVGRIGAFRRHVRSLGDSNLDRPAAAAHETGGCIKTIL